MKNFGALTDYNGESGLFGRAYSNGVLGGGLPPEVDTTFSGGSSDLAPMLMPEADLESNSAAYEEALTMRGLGRVVGHDN